MEKLQNNSQESIIKKFNVQHVSDNENLIKLVNKLQKTKADFQEPEDSWNVVNNPNYLILLESLITSINREELSEQDSEFYFSLLLNIHSRIFSSINLWLVKWTVNEELIKRFLETIEIRLKWFWNWYEKILKSFNDIITSINTSYKNILNENQDNWEIISSLILESISKIEDLDFSFLSTENTLFINRLVLNSKLKLETIIKSWIDQPLKVLIEEKIRTLDKISKNSNDNYVNNIQSDNENKLDDKDILINTVNTLLWEFKNLQKTSDLILLDNNFTENVLSTLERIVDNKYYQSINTKDIKTNIWYILLNIAGTREEIPANIQLNNAKEYSNPILNNQYVARSDALAREIDKDQKAS